MIRSPQQDAAQSHDVAGDGKGDDLAGPVWQQLVAAGPARLENEGLMPGLPLMGELLAPLHFDWVCLHIGETFQLIRQQRDEGIHLFCQRAVEQDIGHTRIPKRAARGLSCCASLTWY